VERTRGLEKAFTGVNQLNGLALDSKAHGALRQKRFGTRLIPRAG
jgi:hypothetical protein